MTSVNAQLERLANHWPSFSARLRRLHDGRSKPSAMSRWCQRTCRRLAEPRTFPLLIPWTAGASATNSGTFTFMRKELRDALGDSPLVKFARYATVHFDSEAAVDFILSVAQQQKWLTLIGQQTLIRSSAAFVAAVGRPRRPGNRVCGSGCSSLPEPKAGSDVREAVLWERSRSAGVPLRKGVQLTRPLKIFIQVPHRDMPTAVDAARQQVEERGEAVSFGSTPQWSHDVG